MYKGLLHVHNLNRWVILAAVIFLLVKLFKGDKSLGLKKVALILLVCSHIQLLVGLYQYFTGQWGIKLLNNFDTMGALIKNEGARFWLIEHFICMVMAIAFITVAYSNIKKSVVVGIYPAKAKWFLLVAVLLILAGMPWAFKAGEAARGWYPGA